MRKEPDLNPDGITRFRDFCIKCNTGIRIGTRSSFVVADDGERDYTCENCLLGNLINSINDLYTAISNTIDILNHK